MTIFRRSLPCWVGILGLFCSGLQAVPAPAPAPAPATAPAPELQSSRAALVEVIGSASCRQHTQCHTVAVGAAGCGGPGFYLAWSSHSAKAAEVQRAATRHSLALAAHQNSLPEDLREQSVCVVRPAPTAQCERPPQQRWGRCVLAPVAGSQAEQPR